MASVALLVPGYFPFGGLAHRVALHCEPRYGTYASHFVVIVLTKLYEYSNLRDAMA